MPRSTRNRRRGPNGRFLRCRTVSLFALPPEVRLLLYKALFSITGKCTLRRLDEAKARRRRPIPRFHNAILATCKTVYAEALPLFYASQTFHYSAELDGVFRQPTVLPAHLGLVKHLSIEVSVNAQSFAKLDAIVAIHVHNILKHCINLSSFTLHVIPAARHDTSPDALPRPQSDLLPSQFIPDTLTEGIAAKVLRLLRPRLHRLSIVTYGGWDTLHHLRQAIAEDKHWGQGGRCSGWPGLSLTRAQLAAIMVKQRRYTVAGMEDVVHPHSQCVRVFHAYGSGLERKSRGKGH